MPFIFIAAFLLLSLQVSGQGGPIRTETKLDQVEDLYGLRGEDVVVVIFDRGIDYTHPDFIDENGNTRIAYIYDMINVAGASDPDNPYGIGTIWDQEEINMALSNGVDDLTKDRYGHGTATAGIACGNGTGTEDLAFRGVVPEATLIVVKITQDPFPAFADQPGQASFFDPAFLPTAFDFAEDKIAELGLPSVTLMNIGSIGGPTDGTSLICREIDAYVAAGHPFVCGVGDDGGADNHAAGTIGAGETISLDIAKGELGNLRLDLWYTEGDAFNFSIERPNGQVEGPFTAPSGPAGFDDQSLGDIQFYHRGANAAFFGATSDRRELLLDISGATGTYRVLLQGTDVSEGGSFHATLNPSTFGNANEFLTYVSAGTSIADYASSLTGLTPTDYVADNSWTDIDGVFRDITGQGEMGELWLGSSEGPTHDGRRGVDFAVPGEVTYAAYSPDTWYSNFSFNQIQGSNGLYGIQNAVSGAAPVATGIIALMLEVNPELTPDQIRSILENSCVADSFTGAVPNPTWGYGKLDALLAIQNTLATDVAEAPALEHESVILFPNPGTEQVSIRARQGAVALTGIEVYDPLGKRIWQQSHLSTFSIDVDIEQWPSGVYFLLIHSETGSVWKKMQKQ